MWSMYNQEEYTSSEFRKNFAQFWKQPIVLYGISARTGNLLEHITDYHVVGLMDGKRKSGEIWGKPILDEREVTAAGVQIIVVIARSAVLGMIYHRIEKFARENHINVYDIHGNDLSVKYQDRACDIPYYQMNWKLLSQSCARHDIVTFDIFDTLLVRKTLFPRDIFEIVERRMKSCDELIADFHQVRAEAEQRLYSRGVNPTIVQIYEELQQLSGADKNTVQRYLEAELETELKLIEPRESMKNFFNEIRREKPVYLISDMYLPSEFIRKMLTKCGYEGYIDIFVSCEYGCSKRNGLFDCFLEQFSDEKRILHIGDDEVADDVCAREAGIDSFRIMNGRELLENSSYSVLLEQADSLFEHLMAGLLCYKAFNDPFVFYKRKGKLAIKDHRLISYLFCAPVFVSFCIWMMQRIMEEGCDFVLYPARDAYVLEKICKMIQEKQHVHGFPNGKYLYTSRRALNAATVFTRGDIDRIAAHEYHGSPQELLWERFHINVDDDQAQKELLLLLDRYEREILESCRKERENYLCYLDTEVEKKCRKIASIDFIASGSVQNGLCRLMPEKEVIGFYFQKKITADMELEKNIRTNSFYKPCSEFEMDANIYQFYLFLELILTSPEPTFYSMGADNSPVFMEETREQGEIDLVMDMQEAILKYTSDISGIYPLLMDEKINIAFPDQILGFLGQEYTEITSEKVLNMTLTDEYISKKFNIFDKL